jgi:hypothetical protein
MKNKLLIFSILVIALIINIIIAPFIVVTMLFTNKFLLAWVNSFTLAITCFIKYYYDVKVHIKNEEIIQDLFDDNNNKSNSIVISNHLSYFDFLYIWSLLSLKERLSNINFKSISFYYLYLLPGIGTILSLSGSMLTSDNKEKSLENIEKCKIKNNDVIMIYPEGGVLYQSALDKSNKYCDKNNIEKTKNCLYPRTGAINTLHKNNHIDTIYTFTQQFDKPHTKERYGLFDTSIPDKVYFKFDKVKTDNPEMDTIKFFRNTDTHLDKKLDKDEYSLIKISLCEKICLTLYTTFFILCIMGIKDSKYLRYYILLSTIIYYSYLAYNVLC